MSIVLQTQSLLHRCLTTADTKEDKSVIKTGRREEEDTHTQTDWSSPNAFFMNTQNVSENVCVPFKQKERMKETQPWSSKRSEMETESALQLVSGYFSSHKEGRTKTTVERVSVIIGMELIPL